MSAWNTNDFMVWSTINPNLTPKPARIKQPGRYKHAEVGNLVKNQQTKLPRQQPFNLCANDHPGLTNRAGGKGHQT